MGDGYYGCNAQKRFQVKVWLRDRPHAIDAISWLHSKTSKVKELLEGHYNNLKIMTSYERTEALFLNDLICPKWIGQIESSKMMVILRLKVNGGVRVSYGYQKGIPRVLRKLFFQSCQMHFDFFFFSEHSFLTFFQKLQKVLVLR